MESILELKGVNKTYPNTGFQLKNVSFSIPYGSIVGFIGENGAGKTTTMGTIIGTLKKDSGTIRVFGKNIEENTMAIKEQIGVVFDEINLSRHLNATQLSKVLRNVYKEWNEETYFYYINLFSLPKQEEISGFSRGMSMKLSIAVALSHDAKLLILDEATAGLDPVAREEIIEIFEHYVTDEQRAILLSSHITSDIEKIADELIFVKNGEILLHVNKKDMMRHYAIVICDQEQFNQLDGQVIVSSLMKANQLEVLVSDKQQIPHSVQMKSGSLDDITLLLMKGEHHERSYS
jgi:ABC-2 type transport system ATP-binding protein